MSVAETKKEDLDKARKQIPAGEFSDGTKVDPEDLKKFLQELEEARRKREEIVGEAHKKRAITMAYANLLLHIHSSTLGGAISDLAKVQNCLALRDKLAKEDLGKRRVAYIGAGLDWQFPVALGAREIDMVDIDYGKPELIQRIAQSIAEFDPNAKIEQGERPTFTFHVNTGENPEVVTLRMYTGDIGTYEPDHELGGVIETLGPTKAYSSAPVVPNVAKHLAENALILNFDFYQEKRTPVSGMQFLDDKLNIFKVTDLARVQALATQAFKKPA